MDRPVPACFFMRRQNALGSSQRLYLLVLLTSALALRLYELTRQDIWWDEARNIDVALRPFAQVATAPELDIHPPIYFWLLHLWERVAAVSVSLDALQIAYMSRWLSVAAGVIGVALLFQLTRAIGGNVAALSAATLAAAAPFWLAESQETRMYTVGFALLLAAALAFLRLIAAETEWPEHTATHRGPVRRYGFHGLFAALSALALLTHYNAVFILVAWYGWWGVWALLRPDRWRRLATVVVCGLAMALLVLPVAPIALRQIPGYANPNLVVPGIAAYLRENWHAYVGGYGFDAALPGMRGTVWLWAVLGLTVVGLLLQRLPWPGMTFLLAWAVGGLALYYIAVVDRGAFNVRYSSFVTPALYALMGLGLAGLGRLWRPLTVIGLAVVLLGMAPAVRADLYDDSAAREDISGLADWLRENAKAGDVIFVDQKYPFGFYYKRYAIREEVTPTGPEAAAARYLFVDINNIDTKLSAWAADARQVFWVQWFESDTDPRHAVKFLLDKEGVRAGEKSFRGYSVDWWQLDPPTEFELAQSYRPVDIRFEPGLAAVELALPDAPIAAGETLFVVLRWARTDGQATPPLKARVALYAADGNRVAQSDERILNDRHLMPGEWSADDRPLNIYKLATPPDLAPGPYTVGLLVYDADTLAPVGYLDQAGNPAGVEVTVGEVEVEGKIED